jgi:uncharacterized protein DUF7002
MDAAKLIRRHPRLFHMAEAGSWASVKRHGLLSTSALLDLYEVPPHERLAIESTIRPESKRIAHDSHGKAVIRDNKPLRSQFLRLEGMSESEWCELLNRHVFFWPTKERLLGLLCARAYRNEPHDVITISTAELMARHGERVRLSHLNSGSTLYPNAPPRGDHTFRRVEDFEHDAVVEVAVQGAVPDIGELAILVERRKQADVLETLCRR